MQYPVLQVIDNLCEQLIKSPIVILQAPPGAGKSTAVPLALVEESWLNQRKIMMLEPRRLAARSVAVRMATMIDEEIGKKVGYRVRFENRVSADTKIEVVTEGILTRMIQHDNSLEQVGLLIFDEFHERSLHADTALALSLQIQQLLRPDLRILIMSATIETEKLSSLLGNVSVITSAGKQFPVTVRYEAPENSATLIDNVARCIKKACRENFGDVLVFLPGAGEIIRTASALQVADLDAEVILLYGDLPFRKQQEAILPHPQGKRKIVLSTAIAETSLTIEGITVVVDSGYSRVPRFNSRTGFTTLETVRVSKDSADQRAGRAGRLAPGVCYRLWNEGIQNTLQPSRVPEIMEADLAPLLLELSEWGVKDVRELTWITPPPSGAIVYARELLHNLKALNNDRITPRGKAMLKLPTHPRISHMLLEASAYSLKNALSAATDLAALLEEKDPLSREAGSDLSLRLNLLRRWRSGEKVYGESAVWERIERLASSWRRLMNISTDNSSVQETVVGKLLSEAYPERVGKQIEKHSRRYKLVTGRMASLPENDPLVRESWISVAHLDAGQGEGKIFLAAALEESDLIAAADEIEVIKWDEARQMVVGSVEKKLGVLTLSSKTLSKISDEQKSAELIKVVREKGLRFLGWTNAEDDWQARVMSLKAWRPEEPWPDVSEDQLLKTLETWLVPFLNGISKASDFKNINLLHALSAILPWELANNVDNLAPNRIEVPSGSLIKIKYFIDGSLPVMEVRLQEVFGLTKTPAINNGKTRIVLHLLSPGYKPVQVTQDLVSFWNNTYNEVRKELKTRYPKHSWPDDPWTAAPVKGVKKKK